MGKRVRAISGAAVVVAVASCAGGSVGPYVRSMSVHDGNLLVERCSIESDGERLWVGACTEKRLVLPRQIRSAAPAGSKRRASPVPAQDKPVAQKPATQEPAPDKPATQEQKPPRSGPPAEIESALRAKSAEVLACGRAADVVGSVKVEVIVSSEGRVTAVAPARGSEELGRCLLETLRDVQMAATDGEFIFRFPLLFSEETP